MGSGVSHVNEMRFALEGIPIVATRITPGATQWSAFPREKF